MKQVHATFRKLDKDMNKVEDQIDDNKQSINREKMFLTNAWKWHTYGNEKIL